MPVSKILSVAMFGASLAAIVSSTACSRGPNTSSVSASDSKGPASKPAKPEDLIGKAAPAFTLADATGKSIHLADYKGKVVLLDFWATWCSPCKIEIPWFMDFEREYKDKGLVVLGVSMDDDGWKVVNEYVAKMKMNYPILLGNDNVGNLYGGVDSLPTTFLIDRGGKIVSARVGMETGKEGFRNDILKLLQTTSVAAPRPSDGILVASAR